MLRHPSDTEGWVVFPNLAVVSASVAIVGAGTLTVVPLARTRGLIAATAAAMPDSMCPSRLALAGYDRSWSTQICGSDRAA
jgi:hypothetical protein